MAKKDIGEIVRSQRKKLGLTADKLAEKVGVDRTYISKIENHNLFPSPDIISKLSDILQINLVAAWFFEKFPEKNWLNQMIKNAGIEHLLKDKKQQPGK